MNGKKVSESEAIVVCLPMPNEINPFGTIHGGNIFKYIDNTGGVTAQRHSRSLVVTASVRGLEFLAPAFPGHALTLKSSMHLAGKTSMEIGVRVESEDIICGKITHVASCFLTYVAVDSQGSAVGVPPLIVETDEEQRRYDRALKWRQSRHDSGRNY